MSGRRTPALVALALAIAAAGWTLISASSDGDAEQWTEPGASSGINTDARVLLEATLRDESGAPVRGALVQVATVVDFFGREREAILDQARTDWDGLATLSFAALEPGGTTAVVRFAGAGEYAPAETTVEVHADGPIDRFRSSPVGISGPFAHAGLILLPIAIVWLIYGRIFRIAAGIRGAEPASPAGEHEIRVVDVTDAALVGRDDPAASNGKPSRRGSKEEVIH